MKSPLQHPASGLGVFVFLLACSTSSHLRKFEDGDLGKEVSAEMAKKFELKELGAPEPSPAPTPPSEPTQGTKKKKRKIKEPKLPEPIAIPVRKVEPMPFQVGEKLLYDIRYVGVTAATFQTEVLAPKSLSNRTVYPIAARAKTLKLFELVYRADDAVMSYLDSEGMFSHRLTLDIDESKQTRKVIELYDYDKNESYYWNRIDHVEKGFKEEKLSYKIQPWSQDPLSALFFMRAAPLPETPGAEFRFPVILDGRPWESVLHYLRTESIYAGGANREARVYHMENYLEGQLRNKDNTIWVSTDAHRYILRVETKVKVGFFAVALDKIL